MTHIPAVTCWLLRHRVSVARGTRRARRSSRSQVVATWNRLKAEERELFRSARPTRKYVSRFEAYKSSFLRRMWNSSEFMRTFKQHFTMSFGAGGTDPCDTVDVIRSVAGRGTRLSWPWRTGEVARPYHCRSRPCRPCAAKVPRVSVKSTFDKASVKNGFSKAKKASITCDNKC